MAVLDCMLHVLDEGSHLNTCKGFFRMSTNPGAGYEQTVQMCRWAVASQKRLIKYSTQH